MKVSVNPDIEYVAEIRAALKANDYFCPCRTKKIPENKCMCEEFRLEVPVGEYCHCGLYKKIED